MAIEERQHTPVAERRHRVHAFAGRAHEVLDDILGADGGSFVAMSELGVAATRETLLELTRLGSRIEALTAKVLDHGDILKVGTAAGEYGDAPAVPGSTAAWFGSETALTPKKGRDTLRLAKRLEDAFHATARALAAGRVNADQALAIVTAVDALPDFVDEPTRRAGEAYLLDRAVEGHHAIALKQMGSKLLEVLDPDGLDEHLAAKLAEEEERAARACFFEMHDDGHGTVHGRFAVPGLNADMLAVALNAIASPKRPDAIDRDGEDAEHPKPTAEVLGQAFCEYIERFPADKLPTAGGINATVVVTMTLETLEGGIAAATLDTGRLISDGEARRLASQCGVIPVLLGSASEVLDLGRTVRLHTTGQRTALRLKHKTCTAEGCSVPAAWCHAHHKTPWSRGGKTSVKDGTLLCPRHHRAVHRSGAHATYRDDGTTVISRTTRRRH
jgi:hypothetical protein